MSELVGSGYVSSIQPPDYATPPFPSLYWPFPFNPGTQAHYLYAAGDIWRFTLLWTLLFYAALHLGTSGYAVLIQLHNWKVIWIAPLIFAFIGGLEALVAGSIIGGLLGALYNAGYFHMSTWVPFVWGLINALVIIISSFAITGGL